MTETLKQFRPSQLERQLFLTALAQKILLLLILGGWFGSLIAPASPWPSAMLLTGLICWLIATTLTAATARLAVQLGQMIAGGAPMDEITPLLAAAFKRFALYRRVHIMLFHELAVVRHRQGRIEESAAICIALLRRDELRITGPIRHRLLLLLADASLRRRDLFSAFHALTELHTSRLELIESMQLLELQTRYELTCGRLHHALHDLPRKVELAELMPAVPAAQVHAMLAHAAAAAGRPATSRWLADRAKLLLPPASQSDEPAFVTTMPPGSLANPG